MKGFTVCVDMADMLQCTLPYNIRHFDTYYVATTPDDKATQRYLLDWIAKGSSIHMLLDNGSLHRGNADFNKGALIEGCLDRIGRNGWWCFLDADIRLPEHMEWPADTNSLYGAYRRIVLDREEWAQPSDDWTKYPLYRDTELGGFCHILHASAIHLGKPPWYGTNWRSAAGYDSELEAKFPRKRKVRLQVEVLHFGPPGKNWCGRTTPYMDGTRPAQADQHEEAMRELWHNRQQYGYEKEKVPT